MSRSYLLRQRNLPVADTRRPAAVPYWYAVQIPPRPRRRRVYRWFIDKHFIHCKHVSFTAI